MVSCSSKLFDSDEEADLAIGVSLALRKMSSDDTECEILLCVIVCV